MGTRKAVKKKVVKTKAQREGTATDRKLKKQMKEGAVPVKRSDDLPKRIK